MNLRQVAILLVSLTATLGAPQVLAQDNSRNWENGNIVVVTQVTTKPGMFNAYINDLNSTWRRFMDAQMEDGSVLSYQMLSNAFSRADEPNLVLVVSYANWAAFDRGVEYFEEISKKLMGSLDNMREAGLDREELREIGSTFVMQEVKFAD